MPELNQVKILIEDSYTISVHAIHSLQHYDFDWRGIYRIDDMNGQRWVLRIVQKQESVPWLSQPAILLSWLADCAYPAPQVLSTRTGDLIGEFDEWWTLLTSYIHGETVELTPPNLYVLGATVAKLHQVPTANAAQLPLSWWHLSTVLPVLHRQLTDGLSHIPVVYQPLVRNLLNTVEQVAQQDTVPMTVIHGDCWYANAIRTPSDRIVLIDWDCAGLGPAVLDVGNLLLTSHYDLSSPFVIEPNDNRIRAIMQGYEQQRRLIQYERNILINALRFGLAFHGGRYLEQAEHLNPDDFVLKKLQARFDATDEIARLATRYLV